MSQYTGVYCDRQGSQAAGLASRHGIVEGHDTAARPATQSSWARGTRPRHGAGRPQHGRLGPATRRLYSHDTARARSPGCACVRWLGQVGCFVHLTQF